VRRQARVRPATDLRVDTHGFRFEREREDVARGDRRPDPVAGVAVEPVPEDDVLGGAGQLVAEVDGGGRVEAEDGRQGRHRRLALVGGQVRRRRDEPLALDRRGKHHRPGPVIDVAALARGVEGDRGLGERLGGQPVAIDDRPVGQPCRQRDRADAEDDQQEEESAARIGTSQHRSLDRLARRQDDRLGQLPETGVDGLLADGRFAAEAIEVGADLRRDVVEALVLELETSDVEAGGRYADLLREREEGEHEGDDDRAEDDTEPVRSPAGPQRDADAPAIEDRALRDAPRARESDGARTGALVDGHGSVAERETDTWAARVEEAQRVGLAGRSPVAELELESFAVLAAVLPLSHLVLAAPVGLATAGRMTLAHLGLLLPMRG